MLPFLSCVTNLPLMMTVNELQQGFKYLLVSLNVGSTISCRKGHLIKIDLATYLELADFSLNQVVTFNKTRSETCLPHPDCIYSLNWSN